MIMITLTDEDMVRLKAIEMDRDAIPRRRQPQGLGDDPIRVLVAEKDEGDLRHA